MSIDLYVAYTGTPKPDLARLRGAITALKLTLGLADGFDIDAVDGFVPMTWSGEDTGAEMLVGTPESFAAEEGLWPSIARCSTRATRRKTRRDSNRRWMTTQWQVTCGSMVMSSETGCRRSTMKNSAMRS
jgi:hypothetical protein